MDSYMHYSFGQHPEKLQESVDAMLRELLDNPPWGKKQPVLIYRGMSGIAAATALSMAYYSETGESLGMLYVRKAGEKSHTYSDSGLSVVCSIPRPARPSSKFYPVFVDDFIDSGETRHACFRAFVEYFRIREPKSRDVRIASALLGGPDFQRELQVRHLAYPG